MSTPVIWLLSAYRADSHAVWADWLCQNITHVHWHKLELPGRHFRWRIRGNPLSWIDSLPNEVPDLIIATSMVDLATLKGLHPQIANTPTLYYFHENQFAYPTGTNQVHSVEPQMVQLYGALAADKLLFNSQYNLESFFNGIEKLLNKMPDAIPDNITQRLRPRAEILPVPVTPIKSSLNRNKNLIVWNHRWEYDKAPELFADAMLKLAANDVDFQLALLGARPKQIPAALQNLRNNLADRIIIDEKADRSTYDGVLSRAGIVISTSLHEFQGLAIMEAVSAGVIPLVPDCLCYPEQYANEYLYEASSLDALVDRLTQWLSGTMPPPADISNWLSDSLLHQWQTLLTISSSDS